MPTFQVEADGRRFEVDAPSMAKAQGIARLYIAKNRSVKQAEAGAKARSEKGLDDPLSPEFQALRAEGERRGTAEAGPIAAEMLASTALLGGAGMGVARLAAGARGLPIIGKALQVATSRPGAAVIGAAEEGIRTGDPIEAAKGALLGAALGRTRGPVGRAVSAAEGVIPAEASTAARTASAAPVAARTAAAAPVAAPVATAPAAAAVPTEAEKIAAQLIRWKEGGMSGGQMVSALKQVYGISPKVGGQMVKELAGVVAPVRATAGAAGGSEALVLKAQQMMGTPGGREAIKAWLAQQPPAVAAEIRALLARGQAHPATVFTPSAAQAVAQKPGYELARMLGQVQ